ncbi:baseplate protein, partial [Escherichia coli]|nr:baseplate protein [Escherichia coli]
MKTTSVFWQPALQAPGEIVRGLDDIRQAIQSILRTPRGSDPHRPEFGSNL